MRKILVTSALPYANGHIHLGHLVEYIQTDIFTRYHKLRGRDCIYMCADDTHGTPIMLRAQKEGITPEELVESMHKEHQQDFAAFNIAFDEYYSTNSPENRAFSEEVYLKNREAGHIAVDTVQQAFCEHDKMFLPDRFIRGTCPKCGAEDQYGDSCEVCSATYHPTDLKESKCAICGNHPVEKESEHYFFKLGDFSNYLEEWTHSGTLQDEMAAKLREWFEQGLKNWDISRDGPYFGFEIPDAPGKYFYVWLDAPIGYMAATKHYCDTHGKDFDSYWRTDKEAEVYHFIGKDILYFHTLFWPAMLHGAGFRTPSAVYAHGFLTVNGQKMSKSRGTFINARNYLEYLDPEYLRYYYAAKLTSRVDDIDLSLDDFVLRVNSDLVGKVVNLASRSAGFIQKRFDGKLSATYPEDEGLHDRFVAAGDEIAELYEKREFSKAMNAIMRLADSANQYVEQNAPWVLAKQEGQAQRLQDVCTVTLNLFRSLMIYLKPVLPVMVEKVETFLQVEKPLVWEDRESALCNQEIAAFKHLMQRMEKKQVEKLVEASREESGAPSPAPAAKKEEKKSDKKKKHSPTPSGDGLIDFDTFMQVDLRVALIAEADHVEGADKLLKLQLDLGPELGMRQVFAGIKAAYSPDELKGRLTVCVANLKPRKMKFGMSEGMVLAAGPGGEDIHILSPDEGSKPGMRIK
uniref:Methionine--tRNA ligase n=1 Tax=Magnetococcus massalia (strain MO-1) TaxID=451514 RepID=A0A1S7LGH2_MAGMO|nr:Methionyl-tRNA synthetase [Candidatus Magnetococcus massalia]